MVLQNLLADARKARLADDYDAAIAYCTAFLGANPGDAEGESMLGLCEIESNRKAGAARIEAAARTRPGSAVTQLNLAILRERQGAIREAVQAASAAAQISPATFECWAQLGKLLGKAEKFDEALAALKHAEKLNPGHPGVQSLIAAAALECGELDRCEAAIDRLETAGAGETIRIRTHLARKRGQWPQLQALAAEWLAADPKSEEARLALAHALAQQGHYDDAVSIYAPLYNPKKPDAAHAAAIGRYLLGARRLDKARTWFERALSHDKTCAEASFGLARISHFLGDGAQADLLCRRTLAANPHHADAFALLAEISRDGTQSDIDAIDAALAAPKASEADRVALLFAKGDFLHRAARADDAFDAWSAANALKQEAAQNAGQAYDAAAQEATIDRLIRLFPAGSAPPAPANKKRSSPIFIIGMPRSGTTLLEAAIAAHPDVDAAGEVPAMPFVLGKFLNWSKSDNEPVGSIDRDELDDWRRTYLTQAERFGAKGDRVFTDKQPSNFMSVGLAAQIFPAARFIYLRRNPIETGFSIFRRNFTRQWAFSTRLQSIAHYYAEHCRIADHWLETMPGRIAFVQYEDLVRNFEPTLKDLAAFCGLEWREEMLRYYEADRSVITFSAAQVRKPPSEKHLDSTPPYRDRLASLVDALSAAGIDLETGARKTTR